MYVFSGDGGFNEALNGSDGRTPLGFVPGGGTASCQRALGLPSDPVEAARRLAAGEVAANLPRPRERRRFGSPPGSGSTRSSSGGWTARPRRDRPSAGRSRVRVDGSQDARRAPDPVRPGARDRGTRARRIRARRERRSLQLRSAGFRSGSRVAPRSTRASMWIAPALVQGATPVPGGGSGYSPHGAERECRWSFLRDDRNPHQTRRRRAAAAAARRPRRRRRDP